MSIAVARYGRRSWAILEDGRLVNVAETRETAERIAARLAVDLAPIPPAPRGEAAATSGGRS